MNAAGLAGVSSGALTIIEQPAASPGATLRTTWLIGKFHGANAATGPDRVLDDHLADREVRAVGDQPPVDAEALLGEPVDDVGGRRGLAAGLGERFALFEGDEAGDVVDPVADQLRRAAHDRAALGRGVVAPHLEPALGRGEGAVEVGDRGVGDRADLLPGRRVVDGDRAPVGRVDPVIVDEE